MSVGILILSRDGSGNALLRQAERRHDELPVNAMALTINDDMSDAVLAAHLEPRLERLDTGNGVLVLADRADTVLSSSLRELAQRHALCLLPGLNVAMLDAAIAHAAPDLIGLADAVADAGRRAIRREDFPLP